MGRWLAAILGLRDEGVEGWFWLTVYRRRRHCWGCHTFIVIILPHSFTVATIIGNTRMKKNGHRDDQR